jgi:hypothetical protein
MRIVLMFASLVVDTWRSFALAAQLRRTYNGICHFFSRDLAVQHNRHHPCWKAAHFLPCTRPPDVLRLHRPQRRRIHYCPSQRRAFVTTRSGLQTMATGRHGHDADTAAVTGAPRPQRRLRRSNGHSWFFPLVVDRRSVHIGHGISLSGLLDAFHSPSPSPDTTSLRPSIDVLPQAPFSACRRAHLASCYNT